jgi:hypothetical protein
MVDGRLSIVDFAALPRMRNVQSRFFDDCPIEEFAFIGICEEAEKSMRRLSATLGTRLADLPRINSNVDKAAGGYDVSPDDAKRIATLNKNDARLYADVLSSVS